MSWSLVSTMLGEPETLLPCIAHHLRSDADAFHVYLDAPHPVIEAALAAHPRCVVTVCDEAYWTGRHRRRPKGVVPRQLANLADARLRSNSDWLVHVDSDEFVVQGDGSTGLQLREALSGVAAEFDWVRIPPMERVLQAGRAAASIFDGVFRRQTADEALIEAAYGAGAPFLDQGLSGHSRGKIAFRRETDLTVRLHDLRMEQPARSRRPVVARKGKVAPFCELPDLALLHFEGWSPLHWASKLRRFAEAGLLEGHHRGRRASIQHMIEHPAIAEQAALFDRVQRLPEAGLSLLEAAGLIRHIPFDPAALTRETFPGVAMDFSVAAFDRRLHSRNPALGPAQGQ